MQSKAKTVTAYLKEVLAERREALLRLRKMCRDLLTGFEESMDYGGPCYSRNGVVEVGFASQKHFIGIYILRTDVMNAHKDQLKVKGVTFGPSGCHPLFQTRADRFQRGREHAARDTGIGRGGVLMLKE